MEFAMLSQLFYTSTVHRKPSGESKSNVAYTVNQHTTIRHACPCLRIRPVFAQLFASATVQTLRCPASRHCLCMRPSGSCLDTWTVRKIRAVFEPYETGTEQSREGHPLLSGAGGLQNSMYGDRSSSRQIYNNNGCSGIFCAAISPRNQIYKTLRKGFQNRNSSILR